MNTPPLSHLYGDTVFAETNVDSWWAASAPAGPETPRLEGEIKCDTAIIGAGYTGLSAALALAGEYGEDVVVVDAHRPGWGASGRNGGFCCFGSAKIDRAEMVRRYGEAAAARFSAVQIEAIELVGNLIETHGIDAEATPHGLYEIFDRPLSARTIEAEVAALRAEFGRSAEYVDAAGLTARGLNSARRNGGIFVDLGFGLHPLRYARGLAFAAEKAGARLYGGSPVIGWTKAGGRHLLETPRGRIDAGKIVVAVNGYHPLGFRPPIDRTVIPALSRIGVTRPLSEQERAAQGWTSTAPAYDDRRLLHYFRLLPDGRFLFGGRGGTGLGPADRQRAEDTLRLDFEALFPAWAGVPFDYRWSGFVAIAFDLVPHAYLATDDGTVAIGHLYHGNGVAMGTWTGRALAKLLAGADVSSLLPDFMRQPPPQPVLPGLRRQALKAAYFYYRLQDRGLLPTGNLPGRLARMLSS